MTRSILLLCGILLSNTVLSPRVFSQKLRMRGENPNLSTMRYNQKSISLEAFFQRIPKLSTDYLLGPGDELRIEIIGQETLNESLKTVRISNSGEIGIPFLGSIRAADLTAAELETQVANLLKEKQLVRNPEVLVF